MSEAQARRDFALEVVLRLRRAGFQALWAGGCVRDLLLGLVPVDYDVATDATPEQVMLSLPFRAITVGISFGVVRIRHPRMHGIEVEVATFRSDSAYVDGRRPAAVVFSSPELDAARRDFTINGMFMDPESSQVIDYVGGLDDLRNQVLRAIGDPAERFREDKLRLLRAIRFAARFNLEIEPNTLQSLRAMAGEVVVVSPERIAQELRRMLVHENRAQAMNMALEVGLVAAILPPLVDMRGLFQGKPVQPEGDLWDHTMLVLGCCPSDPASRSRSLLWFTMWASHSRAPIIMGERAFTAMTRSVAGSPIVCAETCDCPMSSASGSPGWSLFINTWEKPRNFARRSSSECWPSPGSTSCWRCTEPTPWLPRATPSMSITVLITSRTSRPARSTRRRC